MLSWRGCFTNKLKVVEMFRVRVSQSIAAAVVAVEEDDDNEACAAAAAAAFAFCYRLEETSLGDDDSVSRSVTNRRPSVDSPSAKKRIATRENSPSNRRRIEHAMGVAFTSPAFTIGPFVRGGKLKQSLKLVNGKFI